MPRSLPRSRPIAVTAYAASNGLGRETKTVMDNLFSGRRGLSICPARYGVETWVGQVADETDELPALEDEVAEFESRQARVCQLVTLQIREAVHGAKRRWGAARVGLIVGTSTAGIAASERAWSHHAVSGRLPRGFRFDRQHGLGATTAVIRGLTGIAGPGYVVSTACSSSGRVFACAQRLLALNLCDAVLVGGVDTLCRLTVQGFNSLRLISPEPCLPFSSLRRGINIGEGGALLLLERECSRPTPMLLGVGESSDAHHMTSPHPEGLGARSAMERALRQGAIAPSRVDQINVHGTGTPQNDATEGRAVLDLVGRSSMSRVAVVATKGYTGHMLGAAGATEAIFAIESMVRGIIPGSVGSESLDTTIGVELSARAQERATHYALSNSLAFGGSNVSVLFGSAAGDQGQR